MHIQYNYIVLYSVCFQITIGINECFHMHPSQLNDVLGLADDFTLCHEHFKTMLSNKHCHL